jgi:hypothetical protein
VESGGAPKGASPVACPDVIRSARARARRFSPPGEIIELLLEIHFVWSDQTHTLVVRPRRARRARIGFGSAAANELGYNRELQWARAARS